MEYAGSPFELKALTDSGQIEGLLAGFGDVDHGGDQLLPGCLTQSLAKRTTPLPMLLHHDTHRPIGAWREWSEQAAGLFVKGQMTLATRDAQEAHALAKDGALTGLSIGWLPKQATTSDDGTRLIAEAELFEGSLVAVPMNDRTRVSSIKEACGPRALAMLMQEKGIAGHLARDAAGIIWARFADQFEKSAIEADLDSIAEARARAIIEASIRRLNTIGG